MNLQRGAYLRSNNVLLEIIEEFIPMCLLIKGLVEIQLATSDIRKHAQRGHIHIVLGHAEKVYRDLHINV